MKKIRVLIVDDSIVFRQVIAKGISSDSVIEVVATASDPYDAKNKIIDFEPDVMTCDVEMPKMNGIEFIRQLMPQHPMPVVVVSSVSKAVFDAMAVGAVDFVTKPEVQSVQSVETFIKELIAKIKIASDARVTNIEKNSKLEALASGYNFDKKLQTDYLIAIGASTGGTEALSSIIKALPQNIPGIVIVQHIPPVFSKMFAERLNSTTNFFVKEAETGDYVESGKVLIAPGDAHMKIKKVGGRFQVECFSDVRVNGHCPSVDVLFESVAKEVGEKAIGVILTGMGYDGAKGLLSMKRRGARTIGQDEKTSVVYGMPRVAYEIGGVDKQKALEEIPKAILSLIRV